MNYQEKTLRKFIREEIRNNVSNNKKSQNTSQIRQKVRNAIREVLNESTNSKKRLNESVMGMAGLNAINPAQSFAPGNGNDNFDYNPNAVRDRANRDLARQRKERYGNDESGEDIKTGYESSSSKIMFESNENGDRASLWIEGNQLVCEYHSKNDGIQKTKLSENKTREVLEDILNDNFQM